MFLSIERMGKPYDDDRWQENETEKYKVIPELCSTYEFVKNFFKVAKIVK